MMSMEDQHEEHQQQQRQHHHEHEDFVMTPSSSGNEVNTTSKPCEDEEEKSTTTITTEEASSGSTSTSHWELSFLFESDQPTKREHYSFPRPNCQDEAIEVVVDTADDEPGATQSGNYLWPAAQLLARYLVENCHRFNHNGPDTSSNSNVPPSPQLPSPAVVVELGAGNALVSIAAWQLWAATLQCVVVTDHDPSTLERARNNHETTLEELLDSRHCANEDDEFTTINNVGSIPTCFEPLDWNNAHQDVKYVQDLILEHSVPTQRNADYVLGSDLIYDVSVVGPLFRTASLLLGGSGSSINEDDDNNNNPGRGRFILSQSFAYDKETEQAIEQCCRTFGFVRTVLLQEDQDRIQEFQLV